MYTLCMSTYFFVYIQFPAHACMLTIIHVHCMSAVCVGIVQYIGILGMIMYQMATCRVTFSLIPVYMFILRNLPKSIQSNVYTT